MRWRFTDGVWAWAVPRGVIPPPSNPLRFFNLSEPFPTRFFSSPLRLPPCPIRCTPRSAGSRSFASPSTGLPSPPPLPRPHLRTASCCRSESSPAPARESLAWRSPPPPEGATSRKRRRPARRSPGTSTLANSGYRVPLRFSAGFILFAFTLFVKCAMEEWSSHSVMVKILMYSLWLVTLKGYPGLVTKGRPPYTSWSLDEE